MRTYNIQIDLKGIELRKDEQKNRSKLSIEYKLDNCLEI